MTRDGHNSVSVSVRLTRADLALVVDAMGEFVRLDNPQRPFSADLQRAVLRLHSELVDVLCR